MWDVLKQSDIAQAKQQLRLRVDETLRRHAEEIKSLDHDQAELEALNRLLDEFSRKFKTAPAAPTEPAMAAATDAEEPDAAAEPDPAEEQGESAAADEQDEPEAAGKRDEAVTPVTAPNRNTAEKPSPRPRALDTRGRPQTNFDAFSRAIEKAERGGL